MYIDSHCHLDRLDTQAYPNGLADIISEAKAAAVDHMLCVSIALDEFDAMYALTTQYDCISASVGVHPTESVASEPTLEVLTALASRPKVVAVGETGLDFYRPGHDQAGQEARFRTHIQAARAVRKPLIVHTRQAKQRTLDLLREAEAAEVAGVLHCFTEDLEMAEAAIALGFLISFSGIVTFKNAAALREVVKALPLESILIETDAPYLAPVPFRGKSNVPGYVPYVAACIAELKQIDVEAVAAQTSANYWRLFGAAG